jgi:hypothetical protein
MTRPGDTGLRTLRFKAGVEGHWVLAHPMARGGHLIEVVDVPPDISTSQVLWRINAVHIQRPGRTVHFSELAGKCKGKILR